MGSGAEEEIEEDPRREPVSPIAYEEEMPIARYRVPRSLEPSPVREPYWSAPRPRSGIGVVVRFAGAAAVAAIIALLVVGKLPTSWNIATNGHLEERPAVASGFAGPPKSDRAARTSVVAERPERPDTEIAGGEESPEPGERALVSAPSRVTIAGAAMTERAPSAIAQEATPATAQMMAPGLVTRQLDREEVAALLKRGEDFITSGDLASARLVLQRAAEAGDVHAALALAGTFDPNLLAKLGSQGLAADVAMARFWYERAKQFGSTEAPRRLEQLASQVNSVP